MIICRLLYNGQLSTLSPPKSIHILQPLQADTQTKAAKRVCIANARPKRTKKNTEAITSPIRKQGFCASIDRKVLYLKFSSS